MPNRTVPSPILRSLARPVLRPALSLMREAPLWPQVIGQSRGGGRRLLALPAKDVSDGAAHLRIWRLTAGLRPHGWETLVLPPSLTLAQRRRMIRAFGPDVILMQGVRHALNRPALYPGQPVVMDMDDADFHLDHLKSAATEAMPGIDCLIAGSRYIAEWGRGAGAPRTQVVWTGAPVSERSHTPHESRPAVVAWAQTRPMTYTREAALVRRVMRDVAARRPGVTLRLYDRCPGDDPGFADSFAAPDLTVEWRERASYETYLASFDDVAVGLAPLCPETPFSRGKSFGKVLAYLDRKVPVVGSDAGEHGAFFTDRTGVITNDQREWVDGITSRLECAAGRQKQADAAYHDFLMRLDMDAAARRVGSILGALRNDNDASCEPDRLSGGV